MALQSQLKYIKDYKKDAYVALHHLETELCAAACTDPSIDIEKQLVLPLIRDQIHAAAKDLHTAQDQVILQTGRLLCAVYNRHPQHVCHAYLHAVML